MIDSYILNNNDLIIVLAIDACSVSARFSVSKNSDDKGLLNMKNTDDVKKFLSTSQEFMQFVDEHQHETIRYFFVIYACPLSPLNQAFPIALIPRASGNPSKNIVSQFELFI